MHTTPTMGTNGDTADIFSDGDIPMAELVPAPAEGRLATSAALATLPVLPGGSKASQVAPKNALSKKKAGPAKKIAFGLAALLLLGGGGTVAAIYIKGDKVNTADILLAPVKLEHIDLTVVERGTLESAENKDVICRVKAGSKITSSTIKWVIDDGTLVRHNQIVAVLDSSALEDAYRAQKIVVDQAESNSISADEKYKIDVSQCDSDIETAKIAIQLAELDLEKYVGLPKSTLLDMGREKAKSLLVEMETNLDSFLTRNRSRFNGALGEYQQALDDVSGRAELAKADVETWRDKYSSSQRLQLKGFVTPAAVQSDEARLNSATEAFKKIQTEQKLLQTFTSQRTVKDLSSKVQEAWRAYDRVLNQSRAKEVQADSDRKTKRSIWRQEEEKLADIEEQIHLCNVKAPQEGMVVYYVPESSRYSSTSQGMIAQGEAVKEGQKMMRIPDLNKMQVGTKVHEAMISRIKADDRRSTGFTEAVRTSMLLNTNAFSRIVSHSEHVTEDLRDRFHDKEYRLESPGQAATIRVDAFSATPLKGHVKIVATVASQQDWFSSDVRTYQTTVSIDEPLPGLKPGMSAEVTIHIENSGAPVLTIPLQAIVGGAEQGSKRKCYVMTPAGPKERDIVIGLNNDKSAEVREGLKEGDQVVVNPKIFLGDKAKTREAVEEKAKGKGKGKGEGKGGGDPTKKMTGDKGPGGPPVGGDKGPVGDTGKGKY